MKQLWARGKTGIWAFLFLVLAVEPIYALPQAGQSDSQSAPSASGPEQKEKRREATEAQVNTNVPSPQPGSHSDRGLGDLAGDFLTDQKQIWTSPARLRFADSVWLLPVGGLAATLFATDSTVSRHLSVVPSTISHYKTVSDAGIGALVGAAGGMWVFGHLKHNSHWTETGFLAGEATLNSLVAVEALKYSLGRQRPFEGNGNGSFFQGGTSFPSEHAAAAWSVAGVIAHEYPGTLTKIAAYGLAALVDYSRVRARQHFPSDVFVGSIIGNFVAQDIYSRRHDPELGGATWRSMSATMRDIGGSRPSVPASPFVPLDSWVYPAIERLAALGLIDSTFLGSRPWTRVECARLVQEAGDHLEALAGSDSESERIYEQLLSEFQRDIDAFRDGGENIGKVESLYVRGTEIVGPPVNDSYHFGQTIFNDFGRPYQQGFNSVAGFSSWAADGRFAIYVRGEYQHAPAAPGFSQSTQDLIASLDVTPTLPASPIAATNQFRLLDTYVSAALGGWNLSFGKQSLWWGQGDRSALIYSNNAEPIYMFRVSRTVPISLPWILRYLGPMKIDAFFGKLSGVQFPPRPLLHGEKISFKPTRNLEIAFTRLAEMGGGDVPGIPAVPATTLGCNFGTHRAITSAAVLHSYLSFSESNNYGCNDSPGKRTAGFEFSYRVPFLRHWLTLYTDSLSPDDVSPISAPRRAAVNPGIYVSHFPKIEKLDLRVEAANTNTPSSSSRGRFVYFDFYYHDLSLNKNSLIGSWIGREGLGIQATSNYWFTSRTFFQVGYRHAKVTPDFIPQGETFNDASMQFNVLLRRDWSVSASTQYEKWLAPVLSPAAQTNWTSTIGITYQPKRWVVPFRRADQDPTAPPPQGAKP